MLEKLVIKNFQAHEHLKLTFHQGVNAIVGPSDVGKSSIIRALRWLMLNKPQGDSFIRHGSDDARVQVLVDGHYAGRARGKLNIYRFDDASYKAFNREVPDDIASFFNVDDVNFQSQLDSPFLFTLSGGDVAKELNRIVDLSAIDQTIAYANSKIRESEAEERIVQKRIDETKQDIEAASWIAACRADFDDLQALRDKWLHGKERAIKLAQLVESYSDSARLLESVGVIVFEFSRLRKAKKQSVVLSKTFKRMKRLVDEANASRIESEVVLPDLKPLEQLNNEVVAAQNRIEVLKAFIRTIKQENKVLAGIQSELELRESEFKEIKTCPTCGQKLQSH